MRTVTDKAEYFELLKSLAFTKIMQENELLSLMETGEIIEFDPEEIIVAQNDFSPSFFLIIDGEVQVSVANEDKDVYLSTIGAGEFFGEAAIFIKVKRTANIKTLSKTVVLKLIRDDFNHLITHYPRIGNKLMLLVIYGLLKKLRAVNQELAFERKSDVSQEDVDSLLQDFFK